MGGLYRVIHNCLTHFIKLVHLNGRKFCNMWPTDGKRNSSNFLLYLVSAVCVCCLWHGRLQADYPFPPIPAAACHDRYLRWQRWFIFGAWAETVIEAVERQSPQHIPIRKNCMVFGQAILVASKTASGILQSCIWSSVGAIAASLVATNGTKRPWHVQINFESFLFLCVGHMLKCFPPFKCTDFVNCVRELWITLY
jgi:hypothetical protein